MNGFRSLIGIALNWSEPALELAIYAGACAALLATVVLVVNLLFRRWLSARQMGLLWGLVLLRLLLPVAPSSSFSLQNLLLSAQSALAEPGDVVRQAAADSDVARYARPLPATAAAAYAPAPAEAAAPAIDLSVSIVDWFIALLPLVWLSSAAASLIATLIVHWRFCRRLKQVAACEDPTLRSLWEACGRQAGVRRSIPIVLFDGVQQPAVTGLFRPRLLLPEDAAELDDQQLRMVMLHELAHVRRWHIAANWALVVIRAVHWWNPVYWLAAARFQSLREQSCDAFAIGRIGGQPTRDYGELLLMLAQRQQSGPSWRVVLPASILSFLSTFFRKRAVHHRLKALRSAGVRRSRWHTAGVAGLVALAAVCGLTDASTPETPIDRSFEWLPHASHEPHWNTAPEIAPGPLVTRIYDVEKVLQRLAADDKLTEDGARATLKSRLAHLLTALETLASLDGRSDDDASTNPWRGAQENIALEGAVLRVTAPLSAHAEVARNLIAWEQSGLGQISVESRFITAERDIASAIGISWRYLEAFSDDREEELPSESKDGMPVVRAKAAVDDYLPIAVAHLNEAQAFALVQAAQGDVRANVLQAPKITLFNGQRATVLDRTQSPFVVGIQDGSAGHQQAKIAVINEGIKLALRVTQSRDAAKVQLDARVELSNIGEVRTASTLFRGEPATIQLPRVKRCRIDISSEVEDGQSLLVGCIPAYEQKRFFYVLLTPRIRGLTAEESN